MICKHCGHAVILAGGICFHTEKGFSHICKICGCSLPEEEKDDLISGTT